LDESTSLDQRAADAVSGALCVLSNDLVMQTRGVPGLEGMGATVVMALVRGERAVVAHMGDSRAYLLRGKELLRLTTDHSIVQILLESGEITPEEAREHPAHGQITRHVGMPGDPLPEVRLVDLESGDRLLLCTDGLCGMVSDDHILEVLRDVTNDDEACARLVAAANEAGGNDNVTAVVVGLHAPQSCVGQGSGAAMARPGASPLDGPPGPCLPSIESGLAGKPIAR
jgi:protein phosphatase